MCVGNGKSKSGMQMPGSIAAANLPCDDRPSDAAFRHVVFGRNATILRPLKDPLGMPTENAHTGTVPAAHYSVRVDRLKHCRRPKATRWVRYESVEIFRRWHCHTQSATDSSYRRPAPIGLVSLHFDFSFVRSDKSNRSHLCRMFSNYAIPDTLCGRHAFVAALY